MLLLKGFSSASDSKESFSAEDPGSVPELGRSSGEGMATHSSIFAWRIPWTEEPGGLQSIGLQRVNTAEQLSYYGKVVVRVGVCLPRDGGYSEGEKKAQEKIMARLVEFLWRSHQKSLVHLETNSNSGISEFPQGGGSESRLLN